MARSVDGVIDQELATLIAIEMQITDPSALISYCIEQGIVHESSENKLTNSRVTKDQVSFAVKRDKWRTKKRVQRMSPAKSVGTHDTDTDNDSDTDSDNDLNSKKKSEPELNFPPTWGSITLKAFADWQAYRKEIKKPLKNRSYQAQINQFATNPRRFVALTERAISKGWQGLNEQIPFEEQTKSTGPPKLKQNNAEQTVDAVMEILRETRNET